MSELMRRAYEWLRQHPRIAMTLVILAAAAVALLGGLRDALSGLGW